jgi:hypothetical protein
LALLRGGLRVGEVVEWRSSVLGLDAVLLADESEVGDGLLDLLDGHGELPVSPSFRGIPVRHSTRSVIVLRPPARSTVRLRYRRLTSLASSHTEVSRYRWSGSRTYTFCPAQPRATGPMCSSPSLAQTILATTGTGGSSRWLGILAPVELRIF